MIRNNNGAITRKLAKRSLKFGKMRNLFIIITVALSAALISGLAGFTYAMDKIEERELEFMPHATYTDINDEQLENIASDSRINDFLRYKRSTVTEVDNYIIRAAYFSDEAKIITTPRLNLAEGRYPEKINEAAVPKKYMEAIGKEPVIGAEISVTWFDGETEQFIVTGYYDANSESFFEIMVSEEYAENEDKLKDINYTAAVRVADAERMSGQDFLSEVRDIGAEYGIPRPQINENGSFVVRLSGSSNEFIVMFIVGAAVLFTSIFVIYSIFYISVTSRIRQFGQLRTIGMTSKQLRKSVQYEGIFLSAVGIFIGIIIGTAYAYLIAPGGFYLPNTLNVIIITAVACTLTVMFSVRKPAKTAAAASPVDAAKMRDNGCVAAANKHGKRKLTPFGLAKISSDGNRKKSMMTAVSLGLGGVLFAVGTTYIASFNIEEYSRQSEFKLGDYVIGISKNATQNAEHGTADIQIENLFNQNLEDEIAAIDGVKKITRIKQFDVTYEYNNYQTKDCTVPVDRSMLGILNGYRAEGEEFDYDRMVRNKEVIVHDNKVAQEIFGWKFKTGDKVKLRWWDGKSYCEDDFTIAGCVENVYKSDDEDVNILLMPGGWFFIPEELLKTMAAEEYDFTGEIIVAVEDYETDTAVKEFLEKYTDENPQLILYYYTEHLKAYTRSFTSIATMVWGVSAFIIGFALINLINTLVSDTMSRKQEFAMLCSIGMSRIQMKKMIIGEGLILAVKNIFITVIFGTAAGYAAVRIMREFAATYLHWHFPGWYMLGYIVMVLLVPVIISLAVTNIIEKKSLVERLREAE